MFFDKQEVMQRMHVLKPVIDHPPAVFHGLVKEGVSLPWEARALDGLELPDWSGVLESFE